MNPIASRFARAATILSVTLFAALVMASAASAVPVFQASTQLTFSNIPFGADSDTASVVAGAESRHDDNVFHVHARATAQASAFGLRASGFGQLIGQQLNIGIGGQGTATARFDDFVISGPAGPVTTSFNLVLSGSQSALSHLVTAPTESQTQASSFVVVQTLVNGLIVTGNAFFQDRVRLFSLNGGAVEQQKTGMLAGWPADPGEFGVLTFTTPSFTVMAGAPFSVDLNLTASAGVFEFNIAAGLSEAHSDFGSTLAFPTSGAVFNLPAGYTVDSVGARIQNNEFVDAPVSGAVPEPASVALLVGGVAALGAWSRSGRGHGRAHDRERGPART